MQLILFILLLPFLLPFAVAVFGFLAALAATYPVAFIVALVALVALSAWARD